MWKIYEVEIEMQISKDLSLSLFFEREKEFPVKNLLNLNLNEKIISI